MSAPAAVLVAPGAGTQDRPAAAPQPLSIGPSVRYSKADAFEICGALALAESVLRSLGREADAARMAVVFEAAEAGLARSRRGIGWCVSRLPARSRWPAS